MNTQSEYSIQRGTQKGAISLLIGMAVIIALISLPFWGSRSMLGTVVEISLYLALAQLWNLMAGYAGLVSVGQQAFVGLGGYMLFILTTSAGLNPLLALPAAGLISALVSIPTAFLVFRLRGSYFAIGTWVVAEVFLLGFSQIEGLGGGSGKSLPVSVVRGIADNIESREMIIYFTAIAVTLGSIALVYLLLRSKHGLALTAIRDSEAASESLGVNIYRTKMWVYIVSAFGTGIVGAMIFLQKLRISPDAAFNLSDWTANVIFIVVIGGIGNIEGPIIGVLVFFLLREFLAEYGTWYMIILGLVAVIMMLKAPQGLWGWAKEHFGLELFPIKRHVLIDDELKNSMSKGD